MAGTDHRAAVRAGTAGSSHRLPAAQGSRGLGGALVETAQTRQVASAALSWHGVAGPAE